MGSSPELTPRRRAARSARAARRRRSAARRSTADGRRRGRAGRRTRVGSPRRRSARRCGCARLVGEAPVGHLTHDLVAAPQLVDLAERRAVGRAVPGDRRPSRAGRAAASPGSGPGRGAGRRRRCPPRRPSRADRGRSACARRRRRRRCGGPASAPRTPACASGRAACRSRAAPPAGSAPARASRARRSSPCWKCAYSADTGSCHTQRRAGVREQQRARDDQHASRARAARRTARGGSGRAHRRSADSVPPSEPGPA